MSNHVLLQRKAASSAGSAGGLSLTPDLLAAVRRRLNTMAVIMAVGSALYAAIGLSAMLFADEIELDEQKAGLRLLSAAFVMISSGAVVWLSDRIRDGADLERLGSAFVLSVALAAGTTRFVAVAHLGIGDGWSGVSLLIALFPVLVPVAPRKALAVGLAATTIEFTLYVLTSWYFLGPDTPMRPFLLFRGSIVAVGVAWGVAKVVDDLRARLYAARKLGSYELLTPLGHGGMGEVWRARHGALARPAAIKLIKAESIARRSPSGRATMLARFAREAQATALLECPHTIDVYDFGEADDGTLYYAMELLDGLDLEELVRTHGPMPASRAIHLLLQVCESLSEAHGRGLVHRDIKPSNLFSCRYGGRCDFIKVLDFGLVKTLELEGSAKLTADGLMGTPAYLAPEQAIRGAGTDARTDIYALGCVAYWLVTGKQVFSGDNVAALILEHVEREPLAPSRQLPGLQLPPAFEALIMQMLAKAPDDRPQTAAAVAEALAAIALEQAWTEDDARRWWASQIGEAVDPSHAGPASTALADAATEVN